MTPMPAAARQGSVQLAKAGQHFSVSFIAEADTHRSRACACSLAFFQLGRLGLRGHGARSQERLLRTSGPQLLLPELYDRPNCLDGNQGHRCGRHPFQAPIGAPALQAKEGQGEEEGVPECQHSYSRAPVLGEPQRLLRCPRTSSVHHLLRHKVHGEPDQARKQNQVVQQSQYRDEVRNEINGREGIGQRKAAQDSWQPANALVLQGIV
mmetsp:Transcript_58583/g.171443  ORF Transcript_58583/g.171443 Transcript_58583/m.171443 type:complete len:209 (-) Transcript_58583:164-790(-)